MKRGLVLMAGAPLALVTSFYLSTRLIDPPNAAAPVSTLKQAKLADPAWPLNRPAPRVATVRQVALDPMCLARLGSLTRCT